MGFFQAWQAETENLNHRPAVAGAINEQLKSENPYQGALSKLTKPPFDSFGSRGERHFPGKKAPVAVVDIDTAEGPRTITVNDHPDGDRITEQGIYQGRPTPEATDIAARMLEYIAKQKHPVSEAEAVAAAGCDETLARNILFRLAADGIVAPVGGGLYKIPKYPPEPANLPQACPLKTGGPVPRGCRFEARLFARMVQEGVLPLPGGRCPYRHVCGVKDQ